LKSGGRGDSVLQRLAGHNNHIEQTTVPPAPMLTPPPGNATASTHTETVP